MAVILKYHETRQPTNEAVVPTASNLPPFLCKSTTNTALLVIDTYNKCKKPACAFVYHIFMSQKEEIADKTYSPQLHPNVPEVSKIGLGEQPV